MEQLKKKFYLFLIGVLLIIVFQGAQLLVTELVIPKPQSYPISYTATADAQFALLLDKNEEKKSEEHAHAIAFKRAQSKALQVANLTHQKLGTLTYVNDTVYRGDDANSSYANTIPDLSPPTYLPGSLWGVVTVSVSYDFVK